MRTTLLFLFITIVLSKPLKYSIALHYPSDEESFNSDIFSVPKVFMKNKVLISSFNPLTNLFSINMTTLDPNTKSLKSNENLYKEVLLREKSEDINRPEYLVDIALNENYILAGVPNGENLTLYYMKTNFMHDPNIKFIRYSIGKIFPIEEKGVINSVKILPFFYSSKFLIITSWRKICSDEYDHYKFISVDIRNNILNVVKERDFLFNTWTYSYDEYALKTVITKTNKIVSVKNGIRGSLIILTLNEDLLTLYRNDDWIGHMHYFHKFELTHVIGDLVLLCYNYKYEPDMTCLFLQIDINGGIDAETIRTGLNTDLNKLKCRETREYYLKTLNKNNVVLISRENIQEEFTFKVYENYNNILVEIPDNDNKLKIKEGGYLNINMDVFDNDVYILYEDSKEMSLYVVNLKKVIDDYYENSINLVIIIIGVCSVLSLAFVLRVYKKRKIKNEENAEKENNKGEELVEL